MHVGTFNILIKLNLITANVHKFNLAFENLLHPFQPSHIRPNKLIGPKIAENLTFHWIYGENQAMMCNSFLQ